MITKPPLGLRPAYIAQGDAPAERMYEIVEAVQRYKAHGKEIPAEWVEEASYLVLRYGPRFGVGYVNCRLVRAVIAVCKDLPETRAFMQAPLSK